MSYAELARCFDELWHDEEAKGNTLKKILSTVAVPTVPAGTM